MRTNVLTAEAATKLKNFAPEISGVTVKEHLTAKDHAILYEETKILAWIYPAKTENMFVVAWRDDEETDVLVNQLLRQAT